MVEATALDIERRKLSNVDVHVMDAERLAFPGASFDAVLCGFGIMFFPHLELALAEIRRVLRPGGIVAASTWGQWDPRYAWERALQRAYGVVTVQSMMTNLLAEPAGLETALTQAGFVAVQVMTESDELVHTDETHWWARTWANPMARAGLEALDPEVLEQYKAKAFEHARSMRGPDGIPQRVDALFGVGRNP